MSRKLLLPPLLWFSGHVFHITYLNFIRRFKCEALGVLIDMDSCKAKSAQKVGQKNTVQMDVNTSYTL